MAGEYREKAIGMGTNDYYSVDEVKNGKCSVMPDEWLIPESVVLSAINDIELDINYIIGMLEEIKGIGIIDDAMEALKSLSQKLY